MALDLGLTLIHLIRAVRRRLGAPTVVAVRGAPIVGAAIAGAVYSVFAEAPEAASKRSAATA
ncbi:MAG: hypothetical protein M3N41_01040 [Acidobacteriota bacterium]|nr:hypothetical protein [Acidobacteriota bacterium]